VGESWDRTRAAIAADLFRYGGERGVRALWRTMRREPGLRLMVYKRLAVWSRRDFLPLYMVFRYLFGALCRRCCVEMSVNMRVGVGIYISHCHGITLHGDCVLGDNVNISQNVTLGQANRGGHMGVPSLGSRVYVGPGAVVAGKVAVGSNVLISANSLVTRDVPDNAVVLGVPAQVVSDKGAAGYVENVV